MSWGQKVIFFDEKYHVKKSKAFLRGVCELIAKPMYPISTYSFCFSKGHLDAIIFHNVGYYLDFLAKVSLKGVIMASVTNTSLLCSV